MRINPKLKNNLIALLIGSGTSILSLEVFAQILPASSYIPVLRPIECESPLLPEIGCLVRRSYFSKGDYIKGAFPPFPINAFKTTNDIGQFSDIGLKDFISAPETKVRVLAIGDSLTESQQIPNNETYHGRLNSLTIWNFSSNTPQEIVSTMIGAAGIALPDYLAIIKYAQLRSDLSNSFLAITISPTDFDLSFREYSPTHIGRYYFSKPDKSLYLLPAPETFSGTLLRSSLSYSAILRYLFINLEVQKIAKIQPICNFFRRCPPKYPQVDSLQLGIPNLANQRYKDGFLSTDIFINRLNQLRPSSKERAKTIIILDSLARSSFLKNDPSQYHYCQTQMSYLANTASDLGYTILDLSQPFNVDYERNKQPLEFINDNHWTSHAHEIVSREILSILSTLFNAKL